jgi:hypothetical protein
MQPVLAETTAEAAAAAEVRQAVRIEAPSELPKAAVAPAAPESEGGAGLALPKGFDAPKLDQKAVAQAPTPAPIPVADENPAPVMPACDDPRTVELVETDTGTALMVAPICADQVRLSLTDRDGAILKPEFNVIDRTLRADLPCGRVFKAVKMMVGFQPVSVGLVPRELPCSEQVIEAAMPVEEAAPTAPAVPQSGCGNAFDGTVVDGILTAGFSGCNEGEVVTLTYRDHAFDGVANADGAAQISLPLLSAKGLVQTADGAEHDVAWPEANRTIRVVLAWDQPVDLDLYVLEPGQSYNTFETVAHADGAGASDGALGRMVRTAAGAERLQFEVYDSQQNNGAQGYGTVVVSDVSRGMVPAGDHCGSGPLAGPDFYVMSGGAEALQEVHFAFTKSACGAELSRGEYYRRVDDIRPFW